MTTTDQFQVKPDFFSSAEECYKEEYKMVNTNPRYKFFNQTHFTAGDTEQFESYRDKQGSVGIKTIDLSKNRWEKKLPNIGWSKYEKINSIAIDNTFKYIFHKFKKGIFIKIKNGQLKVFLPLSKKNFTNEWSRYIAVDPKYKSMAEFIEHVQRIDGRKFVAHSVNKFTDSWYSNNCLVRWEYPIHEGDTNNPNFSDMFRTLCKERNLPDMELFVNRRDFPLLKKDETEPYDHIYGDDKPLLSHKYEKYAPIFSMVSGDEFADIPIPTGEDWARVTRKEGKFFPKTASRDYNLKSVLWSKRKPIAVFRGSSTGAGVTIQTNPRLKLAYLSKTEELDSDGLPLLDAGITDWNVRPRKLKNEKYLQTIDINSLPFGLVEKLSPQEQLAYKYIINVDGHVCAFRLSLELEAGWCILMVQSKYKLWYHHLLKPYKHFVPVKPDLSDLTEKIRWCKNNDRECLQISINAQKFAKKYLCKEGILDYLQKILIETKKMNGDYEYIPSIVDILNKKENDILDKSYYYPYKSEVINIPPIVNNERIYGCMKAIEWTINMVLAENVELKLEKELFSNNNTVIKLFSLGQFRLVGKQSVKNLSHEAFVGLKGANELLAMIPNFAYTFAYRNSLFTEYIPGQTLQEYINSDSFNFDHYIFILYQLALALHVAQNRFLFTHNDLTPWNIILYKLGSVQSFEYQINDKIYKINTDTIPIIVDMGRSSFVYENCYYNDFNNSKIMDVLTILNISIYQISNRKLSDINTDKLIRLANFISGTKYRPKPFIKSGKDGLGDLRYFFGKAKKYSALVDTDKQDLEKKSPGHFIDYLARQFNIRNGITDSFTLSKKEINPEKVYDAIMKGESVQFEQIVPKKCKKLVKTKELRYEQNTFLYRDKIEELLLKHPLEQSLRNNDEYKYKVTTLHFLAEQLGMIKNKNEE